MSGKLILLIEDSQKVQNYNRRMLTDEGFLVETALTLADARAFLKTKKPDAIILDIGMPDGNGLDFLREFRQVSKIPVLLLTGYGEAKDIVAGFKTGCDDYLPKPYTFEVLLVRLTRLLQGAEQVPENIEKGSLTLKITSMTALLRGEDILLTQKEFFLLLLFAQNEDKAMSAEYIYEKVWGQEMHRDVRAVQQRISTLREKIEGSGYVISSIRTEGYRFEREP